MARCVIDCDLHERVVCIGDVHGDLMVLCRVLVRARVMSCSSAFMAAASACHRGDGRASIASPPVIVTSETCRWVGGSACVVLLGDAIDNQRGDEPLGRCGLPATQQTLLQILEELHAQASRQSGRVAFVLGNHECLNIVDRNQGAYCTHNMPSRFVLDGVTAPLCVGDRVLRTHPAWRRRLLAFLRTVNACAVMLLVSGDVSVGLLMHGMLHDRFCDRAGLRALRGPPNARLAGAVRNAEAINMLFDRCLHHSTGGVYDCLAQGEGPFKSEHLPTWCRATVDIDKLPTCVKRYFDTTVVIKGHDVVFERPLMREVGGDGLVIFTDVAMSRSMRHAGADAVPLAFVEYKDHEWTVHSWISKGWKVITHPA